MRKKKENDRFVCMHAKRKRDRLVCTCQNKIKRLPAEWGKWRDLVIPKIEIAAAVRSFARLEPGERSRFSRVGID